MADAILPRTHPAADVFPLLVGEEFQALSESIRQGYDPAQPVVLHPDKSILDGRNRYRAAVDAGIEPPTVVYSGDTSPDALWNYVERMNLHRRHLDPVRKAACILDGAAWLDSARADAAKRKAGAGTGKGGDRKSESAKDNQLGQKIDQVDSAAKNARRTAARVAKKAGTNRTYVAQLEKLKADDPETFKDVKEGAKKLPDVVRESKRADAVAKLENIEAKATKAAQGVYDVLVIDPPWMMNLIERDLRPNQSQMPYPTMTQQDLLGLWDIPGVPKPADDCHVWLWTTHKFLPSALQLLYAWCFKYVCTFVWHKPGGFQPVGLPQYNCEFALYARRGSPKFIDTKALPTCFHAPRGAHSEKPGEFYATVRRVTAGRRSDMFQRKPHEGFDGWGNES